jgi:arylsulfatase A-like enzyme
MRSAFGALPPSLRSARRLLLLAALAGGCAPPSPPATSLLLITLDTTRADHLGPWGYAPARTPTLEGVAAEGVVFERAYSAVPETLPSHSTMLTGLYPPSHGVRLNLSFKLPGEATTLAERLEARGFDTGAVVAAGVLDDRFGLDQGFGRYRGPASGSRPQELSAEEVTRLALEVADGFSRDRYFLWAHYYDPHSPFEPKPPFEATEGTAPESVELYDLEIAYMDHWVGELLAGLEERGMLEQTAVIVVGDHGESLREHGETYHTLFIYDATQHVPLIVKAPSAPAGLRVAEPVSVVDVFATALSLLGIEPPEGVSSRVLPGLRVGSAREADDREGIYSESMAPPLRFGWAALQAVRTPGWLYVRAPREELYDLARDPWQRVNVAASEGDHLAEMRRRLDRMLRGMPQTGFGDDSTRQVSERERRELEALGYLSSAQGDPEEVQIQGEDPKDMVEVSEAFQLSELARRLGRLGTAEELLHFVVTVDPENPGGWQHYGEVLLHLGRHGAARDALDRALRLRPSEPRVLLLLATTQRELGDTGAAAWHLQEALRLSRFPGEVWRELARLRVTLEDWEGAAEAFRRVLDHEPDDERASWALGQLEARGVLSPEDEAVH